MVYVVIQNDGTILHRRDAWEYDAEGKARRWARENGWVVVDVEITLMGNMVIWVR